MMKYILHDRGAHTIIEPRNADTLWALDETIPDALWVRMEKKHVVMVPSEDVQSIITLACDVLNGEHSNA